MEYARSGKGYVLNNTVFGKWLVMGYGGVDHRGARLWVCVCECGNIANVLGSNLINQSSTQCISCHNAKGTLNKRSTGKDLISGTFLAFIQRSAIKRDIDYDITIDELLRIWELQNGKCALTGIELSFPKHSKDYSNTASLDRIDSNKGYVVGNVQWVHKIINIMKMDLDQSDFINWCKAVANH